MVNAVNASDLILLHQLLMLMNHNSNSNFNSSWVAEQTLSSLEIFCLCTCDDIWNVVELSLIHVILIIPDFPENQAKRNGPKIQS